MTLSTIIIPVGITILGFLALLVFSQLVVKRYDEDYKNLISTAYNTLSTVEAIEKSNIQIAQAMHVTTLYATLSPLTLTKAGKKLAQKMQMENNIRSIQGKLFNFIGLDQIDYEAECQSKCFDITIMQWKEQLGKDTFKAMAEVAYGKGIVEGEFRRMLGILLRDIAIGDTPRLTHNKLYDNS